MALSKAWMFTINNPTEEDLPTLEGWKHSRYILYQLEAGEEGTPHYQGYVQFTSPKRLSGVKKMNGRAHWEQRRGSHDQARAYCMKEEGRLAEPVELGRPVTQGTRTDVHQLVEMAKDVKTPVIDIVSELPVEYVKYHKAVDKIRSMSVPKRRWKTEIFWFHGPTGTGKSHTAFEMSNDPYVHNMSSGKWFDGYQGQEDVIFDDMRKDTFKFHELLRLVDKYNMTVEVKGSSVNWCPKRLFITTCYKPDQMYETREDLVQLLRRIENVVYFPPNMNDVLGKGKVAQSKQFVYKDGRIQQVDGASQRGMLSGWNPKPAKASKIALIEEPETPSALLTHGYASSSVEGFVPPPKRTKFN